MNLLDLVAKITLDSSEYESGLNNAESKAKGFGSNLKKGLGTAGKIAGGALIAVGTAATAATTALLAGANATAQYGDHIDKMSQKLGISSTAYQEWDAILQHSGTSIDSMQRGMMTLSKAAENGSDAFEKLGISQEDVASMSQEDLFGAVIKGLQGMESGTERAVLAQELLGGAAKELGPLLNSTAEETEAMRQAVHDLGGVMSDEAVKSAAAYQDSLQDMQTAFKGLKNNLFSQFLPSITTVMDGLAAIFSGDTEGGIGLITSGIQSLSTNIMEIMPQVIQVASGIIGAIGGAILDNLPEILNMGTTIVLQLVTGIISAIPDVLRAIPQVITTLITGLTEAIPELAAAAGEIVSALSEGISQSLPVIIPAIATLVSEIMLALTDPAMITGIVNGAIAIVQALAEGLVAAIPILMQAAPQIIENLLNGILQSVPLIIEAAIPLIQTLMQGLLQNIPLLIKAAVQIVTALMQGLIDNLPLIVQAAIELIIALTEGLIEAIPQLIEAIPEIIEALLTAFIENAPALLQAGVELLGQLISGVGQAISGAVGTISEKLGEWISTAGEKVTEFGNAIQDGFIALVGEVGGWIDTNIIQPMKDAISSVIDIGKEIVDNIKEGISKAWSGLVSWFEGIWNSLFGNRNVNVGVTGNGAPQTPKAIGMDFVPYNDYSALLHRGEAVLTAREADEWRRGQAGGGIININQYVETVPQTPVELASATAALFERARWAI